MSITSPDTMISRIRELGIVPFTKCTVPGWSIQEMTDPDFWFTTSDELGPWDWKIDAVREGIVYGKFISRKSAFATKEMYQHLMNWRRSIPYFRMAESYPAKATTIDERLQKYISPTVLDAIRERETLDSSEVRAIIESRVPPQIRKKVGGHVERYLLPKVTKQAVDFILQYLDMGTWTVVGDISRVYRGPNCEYKGWQRNSITTPDILFKAIKDEAPAPSWARFIEDDNNNQLMPDCTPEESRRIIIERITQAFPGTEKALEKII